MMQEQPIIPDSDKDSEVEILSSAPEDYHEEEGVQASTGSSDTTTDLEKSLKPLTDEIQVLKGKNEEIKEKLIWLAADFENYKKRALKDKEEYLKFAQASILKELLSVGDNLERALASNVDQNQGALQALKQGVELTLKQFHATLEKHGVKRIEVQGKKFDPRFHEVMLQEDTNQVEDQTILDELQGGFQLHDRVLRHSLVKIARNIQTEGKESKPLKQPEGTK